MILAAGLGTRLRPFTDSRPKALVEVGGKPLLEIAIERLRSFGVTEIIVNVHHFAEMVLNYLLGKRNFGMRIEVSREDVLLDTGGGLKKAAWFFLEDRSAEPFFLHNVDIVSTIDLRAMVDVHRNGDALATLAVQERQSSRRLLFDHAGLLCGRRAGGVVSDEVVKPSHPLQALAFSGIHVISPRFLQMITEQGVFSIIDTYLRLARENEKIRAFRADEYYWRDLGKPENLQQAEQDLQQGILEN